MKVRHVIILTLVALFSGYCLFALQEEATPYVSIAEARARTDALQVKGVVDQSQSQTFADGMFSFYLTDDTGERVRVVHKGLKPDGFDDAVHVVAVGKYRDNALWADRLLIKCPSKYEGRRS